jgi:hypothetical protein
MFSRSRGLWVAAFATLAPISAAQAGNYGWCEITDRGGNPYYQTGVLEFPEGKSEAAENEFAAFARANFDSSIDWHGECWPFYSSPRDAKSHLEQRKSVIENDEHKSVRHTDWTGGYDPSEPVPEPNSSGPYLTIKKDTSLIDARKKQEALELQAQTDQAASIAKRVADTARSRADMQAKLAKLFEEMRKRGSAQ